MKEIRKWFDNQKLSVKIFAVVILLSFLLVLSYTSIWKIVCRTYNNYIYEQNAQVFIAYTEQMENKFDHLNTVTLSIIGDSSIQKNLASYATEEVLSEKWLELRRTLDKQINSYLYDDDFLKFGIYTLDMKVIGNRTDLPFSSIEEMMTYAVNQKGKMGIVIYDDKAFMVRQIRKLMDLTSLGVMIGEIDLHGMLKENGEEYKKSGIGLNVSVFVEGQCLYYDDENVSCMDEDGWMIQNGYFVTQCTTPNNWIYLLYTPYDTILKTLHMANARAITFMIIITVCMLVLSKGILQKIFHQLDHLVVEFKAYGKGILPAYETIEQTEISKDEIQYLHQQFVKMTYRHKQLEEENYNRMLLNKEAQYMQLQKQIQPHFIFNTLSLISWMAYQHEDDEIAELTNSLSKLIRGSMTFNENLITIEQEIKFVESYVCIQKYRYGDRIDFEINIPEELYQVELPQMTLQPLVENAITYGLEEMLDTCVIRVYGRREGDTAICVVEDNGDGIEEDIIEKLISGEKQAQGNGIGLVNVHKRIQMAFSEEYGLSFGREDELTRVYVKLPFVTQNEKGDKDV